MKTTISPRAPIKERRRVLSELITTEVVGLYRRTNDIALTKDVMRFRYQELVPACDRSWLSEDFYCFLVEYIMHSVDADRHGEVLAETR